MEHLLRDRENSGFWLPFGASGKSRPAEGAVGVVTESSVATVLTPDTYTSAMSIPDAPQMVVVSSSVENTVIPRKDLMQVDLAAELNQPDGFIPRLSVHFRQLAALWQHINFFPMMMRLLQDKWAALPRVTVTMPTGKGLTIQNPADQKIKRVQQALQKSWRLERTMHVQPSQDEMIQGLDALFPAQQELEAPVVQEEVLKQEEVPQEALPVVEPVGIETEQPEDSGLDTDTSKVVFSFDLHQPGGQPSEKPAAQEVAQDLVANAADSQVQATAKNSNQDFEFQSMLHNNRILSKSIQNLASTYFDRAAKEALTSEFLY